MMDVLNYYSKNINVDSRRRLDVAAGHDRNLSSFPL